jgi:hypothetical protein
MNGIGVRAMALRVMTKFSDKRDLPRQLLEHEFCQIGES